jgi:hypothetical protein
LSKAEVFNLIFVKPQSISRLLPINTIQKGQSFTVVVSEKVVVFQWI